MFIVTRRFTRAKAVAFVLLLGSLIATLILLARGCQSEEEEPAQSLSTNAERIAYLQSLGWEVAEDPVETLHLRLPEKLRETEFEEYNEAQKEQGFDLTPYCGEQVTRYTYCVKNYPDISDGVQLNLYCCGGTVIAGDVISMGKDGFTALLAYPETEK